MSYSELIAQLTVGNCIALVQGAAPFLKSVAFLLAQRLVRLGSIAERLNEWMSMPGQELKITFSRQVLARRKGIDQTMQSIFGAGFHGGRSISSHLAQSSRNLNCLPVSVQTRANGKFSFGEGIEIRFRQKKGRSYY